MKSLMKLLCLMAMMALAMPAFAQETTAPAKKTRKKANAQKVDAAKAKTKRIVDPAAQSAKADEPYQKKDPNFLKLHESFVARAKQGGVDVLFLGDSITYGWNGQKELWAKNYEPLKAANFGIGGDRTENIIWRLQNGELEGIQPKVVVLLIGTNNTSKGDSAENIAKGIKKIIDIIKEKSPTTKVLLQGVFPRGEKPADAMTAKFRENITATNKIIATYDDGGKSVKYIYFGDKFLQPDGTISPTIMRDFLHLTPAGYQIWVDSINPSLKEMLK